MRRSVLTLILVTALVVACSDLALAADFERPHPSELTYPKLKITTPEVTELSLANDLEGFLIEDHEIPVVDIVLLVRTYFPSEEKYGLNEMARWVIRNGGSRIWPSDKLNDELEFLAASVEVYGGNLSTYVAINCLKKDLPKVLDIFADLLRNPAFPEEKIEMKRQTMLEDIRRRNDQPRDAARRVFNKLIYQGHPFGWETSVQSVNAITRNDLVVFHRTYFHPGNCIIGVSGDVTKKEIVAALNAALGQWKSAEVTIPAVLDITAEPVENYNYAFMDINQAYMVLGHLGIKSDNPDRCAINIMNFILGGGSFTSWITEEVRSDAGLAYSTGSRFGSSAWAKGVFYAFAQTKSEEYARAMTLIIDQMNRMRTEGPTEEEVQKAVDSYLNSHVFDYESKSQVVRRLVALRFENRPLDTPERDMEIYANLTVNDVKRVAQEYLHPDKLTILVVGNAELFGRPLTDFGEVREIQLEE